MSNITSLVRITNPDRSHTTLGRRCLKVLEELGEVSEAYLNVTSASNGKDKTWDDVREEIADVLIVCLDIFLTPLPDGISAADVHDGPEFDEKYWDDDPDQGYLIELGLLDVAYNLAVVNNSLFTNHYDEAREAIMGLVLDAEILAMIPMPDRLQITHKEHLYNLEHEVGRKLTKWAEKRVKITVV